MKMGHIGYPEKLFAVAILLLVVIMGCSLTKHFRYSSNVLLREPPFYMGENVSVSEPVGVLPVVLDRRLQWSLPRKPLQKKFQRMVENINRFLISNPDYDLVALRSIDRPVQEAPDVYVGNPFADESPEPETFEETIDDINPIPGIHWTVVYYLEPGLPWKEGLQQRLLEKQVRYALYITLGVSEYFPVQINWKGSKAVYLGTGYSMPLKWLTSLDDPIEVMHFAGALLDDRGKILRAGAEGFYAKPAAFWQSVFGFKPVHGAEDLESAFHKRRDDLSGRPLAWQVALRNLVIQLLGGRAPVVP